MARFVLYVSRSEAGTCRGGNGPCERTGVPTSLSLDVLDLAMGVHYTAFLSFSNSANSWTLAHADPIFIMAMPSSARFLISLIASTRLCSSLCSTITDPDPTLTSTLSCTPIATSSCWNSRVTLVPPLHMPDQNPYGHCFL